MFKRRSIYPTISKRDLSDKMPCEKLCPRLFAVRAWYTTNAADRGTCLSD